MKKFLSLILSVLVVSLSLPHVAWADEPSLTDSGNCGTSGESGDSVQWSLYSDGTLTISGSGDMADYVNPGDRPWNNYVSNIKSVVIEDGVTSIGRSAFNTCTKLTSVTIPSSVASIVDEAFRGCSSLTSVTFEDTPEKTSQLTSIGTNAFSGCSSLTSITIPSSVTEIRINAFYACSRLTTIKIPCNFDKSIFARSDINPQDDDTYTVSGTGTPPTSGNFKYVHSIDGEITDNGDGTHSFTCTADGCCKKDSATNRVTEDHEFDPTSHECICGIKGGTCGQNVVWELTPNAQDSTMYDLTIKLAEGATSADMADYGYSDNHAPWYDLKDKIKYVVIESGVTSIGSYAFKECKYLESVTIPDGVTKISRAAFSYCINLTSINIPDGVTEIGDAAFYSCSNLTSLYIPASVTDINQDHPFLFCEKLTYIDIHPENSTYSSDNGVIFNKDGDTLILCPAGKSGEYTITDGVTKIENLAFASCTSLTSITIPDSVNTIGETAFYHCTGLKSIKIPCNFDKTNFADSGINLQEDGDTYTVTYGDFDTEEDKTTDKRPFKYVHSIDGGITDNGDGTHSFTCTADGCCKKDSATNRVTEDHEFDPTSHECICGIASGTPSGTCGQNVVWELTPNAQDSTMYDLTIKPADGTTGGAMADYTNPASRPWYNYVSNIKSVVIEDGVTSIGKSAFFECINLTSIFIPSSVTKISKDAMAACESLTAINVDSENTKYKDIDGVLFNKKGDTLITCPQGKSGEYTIPDGVTTIDEVAFGGCEKLTSITIPDSVNTIGVQAFAYCIRLTSINIPNGVTSIEYLTFYGCSGLTSITIPDSVNEIGAGAFTSCSSLATITIPASVVTIGEGAFYDCPALTDVSYLGTADL